MQLRGRARKHGSKFIVLADPHQFVSQEKLRDQEVMLNAALLSSKLLFPEVWLRYVEGIVEAVDKNEDLVAEKANRQRRLIYGEQSTSLEFTVFIPVSS